MPKQANALAVISLFFVDRLFWPHTQGQPSYISGKMPDRVPIDSQCQRYNHIGPLFIKAAQKQVYICACRITHKGSVAAS